MRRNTFPHRHGGGSLAKADVPFVLNWLEVDNRPLARCEDTWTEMACG